MFSNFPISNHFNKKLLLFIWSNLFNIVYTTFFLFFDTIFILLWTVLLSHCALLCLKKSLLILEESEWNWGKFLWNLRLFYIEKKTLSISRDYFYKISTQSFSLVCRSRHPPSRTDFLLHDAIFKWLFFLSFPLLPVFCSLSHTQSKTGANSMWSRCRTFFSWCLRETHFLACGFFFLLMIEETYMSLMI